MAELTAVLLSSGRGDEAPLAESLDEADVVAGLLGHELLGLRGDDADRICEAVSLGVLERPLAELLDEAHAQLVARHLDRCGESAADAARHALVEAVLAHAELGGGAVGGEHDPLAARAQGVEGVEEEVDGARLAREALHVVDDEDIDVGVVLPQLVGGRFVLGARRVDVVADERRGVLVHADPRGVVLGDVVLDRAQKVRLSEAALSVDKKKPVALVHSVCHLDGGVVGDHVLVAADKAIEGELGVARAHVLDERVALAAPAVLARGALWVVLPPVVGDARLVPLDGRRRRCGRGGRGRPVTRLFLRHRRHVGLRRRRGAS